MAAMTKATEFLVSVYRERDDDHVSIGTRAAASGGAIRFASATT